MKNLKIILASILCFQLGLAPIAMNSASANPVSAACETRIQAIQQKITSTAQILLASEKEKTLNEYANQTNVTPEAKEKTKSKIARLNDWMNTLSNYEHVTFTVSNFLLSAIISQLFVNIMNRNTSLSTNAKLTAEMMQSNVKSLEFKIAQLQAYDDKIAETRDFLKRRLDEQKKTGLLNTTDKSIQATLQAAFKENERLSKEIKKLINERDLLFATMTTESLNFQKITKLKSAQPLIQNRQKFDQIITQLITNNAELHDANHNISKALQNQNSYTNIDGLREAVKSLNNKKLKLHAELKVQTELASSMAKKLKLKRVGSILLFATYALSVLGGSAYLEYEDYQYKKSLINYADLSHSEKLSLKNQDRADKISFLAMLANPETQQAACNAYNQNPAAMNLYEKSAITALLTEMLIDIKGKGQAI